MVRFDKDPNILKWGSEEVVIKYINAVDNKIHRYYPDFVIQYKNTSNEVKHAMLEVKPQAQTKPPTLPASGKQNKRYINEMVTYMVNESKWLAAKAWCKKQNWDFLIIDEFALGIVKGTRK